MRYSQSKRIPGLGFAEVIGERGKNMAIANVFDKTLQKSLGWLEEIRHELNTADDNRAYLALRTVLHTLRDHLQLNEAIHLGSELPMLIRGLYFEGWDPHSKPTREKDKTEFLKYFRRYFTDDTDAELEKLIRAVVKVLAAKISKGEIKDVKESLPRYVREMWAT